MFKELVRCIEEDMYVIQLEKDAILRLVMIY